MDPIARAINQYELGSSIIQANLLSHHCANSNNSAKSQTAEAMRQEKLDQQNRKGRERSMRTRRRNIEERQKAEQE